MSLTDPIADMIARIKNGLMRSHKKIDMPASIFKTRILDVLKIDAGISILLCDLINPFLILAIISAIGSVKLI